MEEEKQEVCEICMRRIAHPVCAECYMKHVVLWLRDFGLDKKQIGKAVVVIKERLPRETLNENTCVLCGKEKVSICMYCAFLKTSPVLVKLGAGKNVSSYLESANFAREHDGI